MNQTSILVLFHLLLSVGIQKCEKVPFIPTLIDSRTSFSDVAILALAHTDVGVQTQRIWQQWWAKEESSGIHLYAIGSKFHSQTIWNWFIYHHATRWGSLQVVYATLWGLARLLLDPKTANVSCVYLVSGNDIPLISTSELRNRTCSTTYSCEYSLMQILKKDKFRFTQAEQERLQHSCGISRQWIVWSRADALESLYHFFILKESPWVRLLNKVADILMTRNQETERKNHLKQRIKTLQDRKGRLLAHRMWSDAHITGINFEIELAWRAWQRETDGEFIQDSTLFTLSPVPDEWYLQNLLFFIGGPRTNAQITCTAKPFFTVFHGESPFTWENYTARLPQSARPDDQGLSFMDFASRAKKEGFLFFRKVVESDAFLPILF